MQATPVIQSLVPTAGPAPIAPELLRFIGGGVAAPTSSPTPQAPKSKW